MKCIPPAGAVTCLIQLGGNPGQGMPLGPQQAGQARGLPVGLVFPGVLLHVRSPLRPGVVGQVRWGAQRGAAGLLGSSQETENIAR